MLNKLTFNVNALMPGDLDYLIEVLRLWKPTSIMCMNNPQTANRLGRVIGEWGGRLVYRPFENEEGFLWKKRTPRQHVAYLRTLGLKEGTWFNVGNEPRPEFSELAVMSQWYSELANELIKFDMNAVLVNFPTAAYERNEIAELDSLLKVVATLRDIKDRGWSKIMLGFHAYGHGLLPYNAAGRDPANMLDNAHWPTPEEFRVTERESNWVLGRELWFYDRMHRIAGTTDEDSPDAYVTECFHDRLPHMELQFPTVVEAIDSLAGKRTRGVPTMEGWFRWLQPNPDRQLADEYKWALEVYPDFFKGFAIFTWSDHNAHPDYWRDNYGMQEMRRFHKLWAEEYLNMGLPEFPIFDMTTWLNANFIGQGVNYRSAPRIEAGNVKGRIRGSLRVWYHPTLRHSNEIEPGCIGTVDECSWTPFVVVDGETILVEAWVRKDVIDIVLVPNTGSIVTDLDDVSIALEKIKSDVSNLAL